MVGSGPHRFLAKSPYGKYAACNYLLVMGDGKFSVKEGSMGACVWGA